MQIKVCHLIAGHSPFDVRIFHKETKTLAKAGYEVIIIAEHDKEEVVAGVRIIPLPKTRSRVERMTKGLWRLFKLALKQKADIYHFHDPELIPVGMALKWLKRARVIYDVHEDHRIMLSKHYIPKWLRKPVSWIVNRVENFSAKRFNAVVTPTQPITERFSKIALEPSRCIIFQRTTLYNLPIDLKLGLKNVSMMLFMLGYYEKAGLSFCWMWLPRFKRSLATKNGLL